jgi:uncharacterized protein
MRPVMHGLRFAIQVYRYALSPVLPKSCRFEPTCSAYALEALHRHGVLRGGWLAATRIARCHPWGDTGFDPVPDRPWRDTTAASAGDPR